MIHRDKDTLLASSEGSWVTDRRFWHRKGHAQDSCKCPSTLLRGWHICRFCIQSPWWWREHLWDSPEEKLHQLMILQGASKNVPLTVMNWPSSCYSFVLRSYFVFTHSSFTYFTYTVANLTLKNSLNTNSRMVNACLKFKGLWYRY